jgi:recombination protein RecT
MERPMTDTQGDQLLAKVANQNMRMNGADATPIPAKGKMLDVMFNNYRDKFAEMLCGSGMNVNRFVRILITEVGTNPNLLRIAVDNPASLIGACMEMAQLGLDPSVPNEVFLIPYGPEAQCQTGYKGLQKLAVEAAHDAGCPLNVIRADVIFDGDMYDREMGDAPFVRLRPPPFGQDRGKPVGYVAYAKDVAGKINFREMTVKEVQDHKARFSKAKRGPFTDPRNFDAYGLKTVLRQLCWRDLPMGPKLTRALALDPEHEDKKALMYPLEPGKDSDRVDLIGDINESISATGDGEDNQGRGGEESSADSSNSNRSEG